MKIYIDTNVLTAFFDDSDRNHSNVQAIFQCKDLELYGGTISILEFQSIMARNFERFQFNFDELIERKLNNISFGHKIQLLTEWCLKKTSIRIPSGIAIETMTFNQNEMNIENTYHFVWKINADLRLRTLDAIHIATAMQFRIFEGIDIQYFLTNDDNILEKKEQIYQRSRIFPISSNELLTLVMIPKTEGTTKENTTYSRK